MFLKHARQKKKISSWNPTNFILHLDQTIISSDTKVPKFFQQKLFVKILRTIAVIDAKSKHKIAIEMSVKFRMKL